MQSQKDTVGLYKTNIINVKSKRDDRSVQSRHQKCRVKKREGGKGDAFMSVAITSRVQLKVCLK